MYNDNKVILGEVTCFNVGFVRYRAEHSGDIFQCTPGLAGAMYLRFFA